MNNGEVTQLYLLQQLGNPGANPRDREALLAVLNFISQPQIGDMQNVHAQMASPNMPMQQPVAGVPLNPMNHDLLQSQQMFLQHQSNMAASQKQQLRISPLPNSTLFLNISFSCPTYV